MIDDNISLCKTAEETLAEIEKEIAWNEQRLTNLVWGEDDRRQAEDYIADLRQERKQLLAALGNV